jgi:hypothetical protein
MNSLTRLTRQLCCIHPDLDSMRNELVVRA